MRKIGNRILGVALAAWLLALAGCGTAPMAPKLGMNGTANPGAALSGGLLASRDDGGGTRSTTSLTVPLPAPLPDPGSLLPPVLHPPVLEPPRIVNEVGLELDTAVSGTDGATIRVADVTVKVPPGAIDGTADIKVTVPDSTKLECHLEISPASKNHFEVPVRLEFNAGDRDARVMTVFWFDEAQHQWVQLPSYYDAATKKVWAELPHFSIYKADSEIQGRAGW